MISSAQIPERSLRWPLFLKLAVSGGLIYLITRFLPLEDIWTGMQRTHPGVWLTVLVGFLAGHVLAAYKWQQLVARDLPFLRVLKSHYAGLAANLAMPGVAGGDVARAALLARSASSKQALVTGSIIDRLVDVGVLVIIAAVGATLLDQSGAIVAGLQIAAVIVLASAALAFAALPWISAAVERRLGSQPEGKLKRLIVGMAQYMASHRTRIALCALLSLMIQTGFVGLNILLSRSMGGPDSVALWLLAWPLAKLIATLPISLGGLGVREASLAAVFAAFSVVSPIIIAVGFVWQTIIIAAGLIGAAIQLIGRPNQKQGDRDVST